MKNTRQFLEDLLAPAGITINGVAPWDIQVHDERFFKQVLRQKTLGLGEAYMKRWWDCRQLDVMIYRLLSSGIESKVELNLRDQLRLLASLLFNLQRRGRSRKSVHHHYDLGNDLFFSFLDEYNQYSCGYFDGTDDLDQAQQNKLELICRKLNLAKGERLLDIGCGWGGLAKYAAENFHCEVTAVNISQEQLVHARNICKGLPVIVKECDYRAVEDRFDKIVSVGMFEHVGHKNYRAFMKVAHRCLEDDGIFLLHTIGGNRSMRNCDPWICKYIFHNSVLPSPLQLSRAMEGLFMMEDWHNLGPHYDKTLLAWNTRFQQAWPRLQKKYDSTFKRMWEYYLLTCAGAFRARSIQVWQIVMTKVDIATPQPQCRFAGTSKPAVKHEEENAMALSTE